MIRLTDGKTILVAVAPAIPNAAAMTMTEESGNKPSSAVTSIPVIVIMDKDNETICSLLMDEETIDKLIGILRVMKRITPVVEQAISEELDKVMVKSNG